MFLTILKRKKKQIYCLQDTHFIKENEANIIDQWGNSNCIFSNYKSNARGVAILFGSELDYKINNKLIDQNGNYIIVDITVASRRLTLVNLYGPSTDELLKIWETVISLSVVTITVF